MIIKHLFDAATFALTYLVYDEESGDAVIIDPVLDFDPASGIVSQESVEKVKKLVFGLDLKVRMILEPHAHADHFSSSQVLKDIFPGAILAIGEKIQVVQEAFTEVFNLGEDFEVNGIQFDRLLQAWEEVSEETLSFKVLPTPGHTPACVSFLFDGAVFTGDTLFMPDYGTGRFDFPAGSAGDLYHSISETLFQ